MASGFGEREEGNRISALGTVMRQITVRDEAPRLSPNERAFLEHVLEQGLTEPDFYAVRKISEFAAWPSPALLCLLLCEQLARSEGSTYLSLEKKSLSARLALFGLDERGMDAVFQRIPGLAEREPVLFAGNADRTVPFIVRGDRLYRHAHHVAERRIADIVRRFLSRKWATPAEIKPVFHEITETYPLTTVVRGAQSSPQPIRLAPEQALAALTAVHAPLTLISGGPGTGKTSVVVTILRLLSGLGVPMESIALAAPTGRAANRMGEAIRKGIHSIEPHGVSFDISRCEPRTLHRLLRWSPAARRFRYDEHEPLEPDWIIVDECSMVDLFLMESLLTALKPETRLILLGDARQLPSVEAGAVFRDLSLGEEDPLGDDDEVWPLLQQRLDAKTGLPDRHRVRLARSFRQNQDRGGRHILQVARAIEEGDPAFNREDGHIPLLQTIQPTGPLPNEGVAHLDSTKTNVVALVERLFTRFYRGYQKLIPGQGFNDLITDRDKLDDLFGEMERVRVLCLTHGSVTGVTVINRLFKEKLYRGDALFYPGLPWMATRNDYRQGIYNGEIGIGLEFQDTRHRQWLVFRGEQGYKRVPFESMAGPVLAFATTVHKSQGSETDHVVLILPDQKNALCRKEVIYTALTRARKSVLIHGRLDILKDAVSTTMERVSGLRDLIASV